MDPVFDVTSFIFGSPTHDFASRLSDYSDEQEFCRLLDRELVIDLRHDHRAVPGRERSIHLDSAAVRYSRLDH